MNNVVPELLAALKMIRGNRASHDAGEECVWAKCGECGEAVGWPSNSVETPVCEDCIIAAAIAKAEGTLATTGSPTGSPEADAVKS